MLGCSHKYHKVCLLQLIGEKKWAKCAICSTIFGHMTGDQPDGTMSHHIDKNVKCSGYPNGTITINYHMKAGHRNGKNYPGTSRTAYLPTTPEGYEVFELLKEAFDRKLSSLWVEVSPQASIIKSYGMVFITKLPPQEEQPALATLTPAILLESKKN